MKAMWHIPPHIVVAEITFGEIWPQPPGTETQTPATVPARDETPTSAPAPAGDATAAINLPDSPAEGR
ncbi:hypothetical protein BGZ81_000373, partial [Podila clonocystis]